MAHSHPKAITAKAKKLRKAHPSMTWISAIREASRKLKRKPKAQKRKRVSGVEKRRPSRSKTIRRIKKFHSAEGKAIKSLGSVASHLGHAKKIIEHEIGKLETQKFKATKKSTKRKISKRIAAKKSQFRKLC
jgi:hypothetical protein